MAVRVRTVRPLGALRRPTRARPAAASAGATIRHRASRRRGQHLDVRDALAHQLLNVDNVSLVHPAVEGHAGRGVRGASMLVLPGEMIVIEGPTGHGKTTLMRMLAGESQPQSGMIALGRQTLASIPERAWRRAVGYLAQGWALPDGLTVAENVALPMQVLRYDPALLARRVRMLLDLLDIPHLADRVCDRTLSGGERQRAALARAIAHEPALLLCDEPTGDLDGQMSLEVLRLLNRVNMAGTTVICVSHDSQSIETLAARRMRMCQGRLSEIASGAVA